MKYEIHFAKVTNFGKLSDRFLTCQHLKPGDLSKSSMGECFSLVEILSPWYHSAQIGQMIINNFANTYWQGGSTSDLVNFENSLKKVNENLGQITQNGETEWVGKLNGVLAVAVGDNFLLSCCGKVEAYLFRDGKVNHLTYGLANNVEVHPLKTFSNIISGQLKEHDKILIANHSLFDHLALESLRQIITLNNPSEAALQFTKLLRKDRVNNTNLIVLGLFPKEELSSQPLKENLENVFYLDKSNESILLKIKVIWKSIIAPGSKVITKKGFEISSSIAKKAQKCFGSYLKKRKADKPLAPQKSDKFQEEFILKDNRDDLLLKDEEIQYSPELYVHYYQDKKTQKENKIIKIFKLIINKARNFILWLFDLYRHREKRKYFYLIIAVVIIILIGLFVLFRNTDDQHIGNLDAQKILDQAIAAQKEGKDLIFKGEKEEAKTKFMTSIEKAQNIAKNPLVAKDAEAVIVNSFQELDKLTSTVRFDKLEPIVKIADAEIKGIFVVGGDVYFFSEQDIFKATLLGGKAQKIASVPKNKGNFSFGTLLGNTIYLYTSNQNLLEFNTSSAKITQAEIPQGHWETANAITGYVGSVYLLDGVLGQIYKHSSSEDVFQGGEEYLANNAPLKEAVSLAIDGSIYVLKNSGEVMEFQRSKKQDFGLKNIPTPWDKITEPHKIYTDTNTPSIYVLDNGHKRILEFDKEGFYVRQYLLPENFQKITDFSVSVKSKKIWVLNDNSLYEIAI